MTDRFDAATRSRMMSAVKRKDTKPELALRTALRLRGLTGYRLHRKDVPGRPDLAWVGRRVAVFVDGAFWHGHPSAYRPGRSGLFWDTKIAGNIARDRRADAHLKAAGWAVVRLWDFEVERDPDACVARVADALAERSATGALPASQRVG